MKWYFTVGPTVYKWSDIVLYILPTREHITLAYTISSYVNNRTLEVNSTIRCVNIRIQARQILHWCQSIWDNMPIVFTSSFCCTLSCLVTFECNKKFHLFKGIKVLSGFYLDIKIDVNSYIPKRHPEDNESAHHQADNAYILHVLLSTLVICKQTKEYFCLSTT